MPKLRVLLVDDQILFAKDIGGELPATGLGVGRDRGPGGASPKRCLVGEVGRLHRPGGGGSATGVALCGQRAQPKRRSWPGIGREAHLGDSSGG